MKDGNVVHEWTNEIGGTNRAVGDHNFLAVHQATIHGFKAQTSITRRDAIELLAAFDNKEAA